MLRYSEFINENYDLILESDVKYSEKFRKILKKIDDPISAKLLEIENKDLPIQSNYFDIPDGSNDTLSFIPDRKVKEILDKNANKWRYEERSRFLSHDAQYQYLWDALETPRTEAINEPEIGAIGTIGKEAVSPVTGKKFVIFIPDNPEYPPIAVNFEALRLGGGSSDFFKTNRQSIRIGRGIRSILTSAKEQVVDKDIENFVNKFKATIDSINDVFANFEVVKGYDIAYWYNWEKYSHGTNRGTLGGSCMADVDDTYFDIYCQNSDKVSLVIYKDEDFEGRIKARALVWTLDDGKVFMDRIYTHFESDVELFRQFARNNGWYSKYHNSSTSMAEVYAPDGSRTVIHPVITLRAKKHQNYPYLDTLKYYNPSTGIIKNEKGSGDLVLEDTEGHWTNCDTCHGEGYIECDNCNGNGEVDCDECDGRGTVECSECEGEELIKCSKCDGSGEITNDQGEKIKCEDCNGDGTVECPTCHGNGREECPTCEGEPRHECSYCDGRGTEDCPECNG